MTKKALLFAGSLALAAVAFASPKSYEIVLISATRAGATQLAAGQYRVQLQGGNAIFTNIENRHSFVAAVKVATTQKHQDTTVEISNEAGGSHITAIDLGGSAATLEFGE